MGGWGADPDPAGGPPSGLPLGPLGDWRGCPDPPWKAKWAAGRGIHTPQDVKWAAGGRVFWCDLLPPPLRKQSLELHITILISLCKYYYTNITIPILILVLLY
jgi:hypothetical protein